MPPVPKVILARPGRTQPWPTSDACWSPAMPQIGGAPSSAVASGPWPDDSMTSAGSTRGSAARRAARRSQRGRRRCGGRSARRWSGRSRGRSRRSGARRSSCRPCRRRGPGAVGVGQVEQVLRLGGRHVGREVEALLPQHQALADRAEVLPADARADGLARARSHTMVDARWLAMPTGDHGPPAARRPVPPPSAGGAIAAASNSTKPGSGEDGRTSRWCTW